jgi:hypothetical protein
MVGRELQWMRPSVLRRQYELRSGDTVVGEFGFERSLGWTALGKTGEGTWTFDRSGFLRSRITVRDATSSNEVGTVSEKLARRRQQVILPDSSSYAMSSDFFRSRFTLETATGEQLAVVQRRGFFRIVWHVEVRYKAKSIPELPWLVLLVWYHILIQRSRSRKGHG